MSQATDRGLPRHTEHDFARSVDLLSPGLLDLARCFTSDHRTAERMVVDAWLGALDQVTPGDLPTAVTVVRVMATIATADPPALGRARRSLALAVAAARGSEPPFEPVDVASGAVAPGAHSGTLRLRLASLPPAQRIAVLLHDVHRWPAHDVAEVLGVPVAGCRRLLAVARAALSREPAATA